MALEPGHNPFVFPPWVRSVSSGLGFSYFGIGSLLLVFFAFPLVRLLTADPVARRRRTRRLIQAAFRSFIRGLVVLGSIRVRFENRELLEREGPLLVIANHPSLIDVCLLVSWIPDADCVVKRAAWSNPFLGGVVRAADYIPNDGGDALVDSCVERLRMGQRLVLFPEGTRSPKRDLQKFQRGAARIALRAGCPVLVVDIRCDPPFLTKSDPWYRVPETLPCYTVTAHEPEAVGREEGLSEGQGARRLTSAWRRGFEERLGYV